MQLKTLASMLALSFPVALCAAEKININTADATTLADGIDGVGIVRAQAIIEHRETFGPFPDVDGLVEVKGIGPATVDRNREVLTVAPGGAMPDAAIDSGAEAAVTQVE